MPPNVEVITGCRLHLGLCPLNGVIPDCEDEHSCFAGLGVTLNSPGFKIGLSHDDESRIEVEDPQRTRRIIECWRKHFARTSVIPQSAKFKISVNRSIPQHHGFGSGTQFDLGLFLGLQLLYESDQTRLRSTTDVAEVVSIARLLGRGERSLVGCIAFAQGGLVWDSGHIPNGNRTSRFPDDIAQQRIQRLAIPESWRVLLVTPRRSTGLSGDAELAGFADLESGTIERNNQLWKLAREYILPAVVSKDFGTFADSVTEYCRLAGTCFKRVQGGPYARGAVSQAVKSLRSLGAVGVGQSSWGPCVFAWFDHDEAAQEFTAKYGDVFESYADLQVSQPRNHGALIRPEYIETARNL